MTGAWPIVPDASIVRILGTDGIPVGVGVLVGDRRVLTCAHVVNVALGRPARDQSLPSALLSLDLPLSPGGVTGRPLSAKVTRWLPPPMEGVAGDDIAGLDLMDEPPASATIARLAQTLPAAGAGRSILQEISIMSVHAYLSRLQLLLVRRLQDRFDLPPELVG